MNNSHISEPAFRLGSDGQLYWENPGGGAADTLIAENPGGAPTTPLDDVAVP